MREIWKYVLGGPLNRLSMPQGAHFLSAHMQNGVPCVWALVDPAAPLVERSVSIFMTGELFNPEGLHYVGTMQDGAYVLHVFATHEKNPQIESRTPKANADIRNT